ncbi:MAG: CBS domain-containing protein, partial [Actinomyces sp.]
MAMASPRLPLTTTPELLAPARGYAARFAAYALVGTFIGVLVAGIERAAELGLLERVLHAPFAWQIAAPGIGLVVAALVLNWVGGGLSPSTSDEYVRAFHSDNPVLPLHALPVRILAGIATVGLGGTAGLEGPSIYTGATIASNASTGPLRRLLGDDATRSLLAAGAAAGVAAIFKAPATGVLFALEAPYRNDVARRSLVPALVASATSYLTFAAIAGNERLFAIGPSTQSLSLRAEVGGALALGLLAGLGARVFAQWIHAAKDAGKHVTLAVRLPVAVVGMGVAVALAHQIGGTELVLGPSGAPVVDWALDPSRGLGLIAALFVVRMAAVGLTLGGGGVGGVFIPLALQGVLLGRLVAGAVGTEAIALYTIVGLAAFLGAGYRTPLAAVMFVAESTGRADFVVPALLATAVSQALMGPVSIASYQQDMRRGHLEQRMLLPVTAAMDTGIPTVDVDTSVADLVNSVGYRAPAHALPVVDGDGRYLGLCRLVDAAQAMYDHGPDATVKVFVREDPAVDADAQLRTAIEVLARHELDTVAVTDAGG